MENLQDKLKRLAKGKKLLLVEDDVKTRDVLKSFLSEYFALIKVAGDGAEAWKVYRQEHFDLVISDIEMPKTNGVMLSKGIKARNSEQSVLISSAYTDERYLVELINIGVDGFLKKPVNIDDLYKTIIKALTLVQVKKDVSRVQFQTIAKEITKKEIPITQSPYQKALEETHTNSVKISVKEFMDKMKDSDPESYEFLVQQKEALFDNLFDMMNSFELFGYKDYKDQESFNLLIENIYKLHNTLEFFDKVKKTATEILRLATILDKIVLDDLTPAQVEAFDIVEFLINDIKQYMLDMFMEENVQDINYFHDSLRENITTFQDTLNEVEEDDEDIEFL
jgi:DNA-binding response OmpR family regulator